MSLVDALVASSETFPSVWNRGLAAQLLVFNRLLMLALLPVFAGCAQSNWPMPWRPSLSEQPQLSLGAPEPVGDARVKRGSVSVAEKAQQIAKQGATLDAEAAEPLVRELTQMLADEPSEWNRREIVRALGTLKNAPSAVSALEDALSDPSNTVRQAACDGLGKIARLDSIQVLGHTLTADADLDVRLAAARALGKHRRPEAVLALTAVLDDPDAALRYRAMQSLAASSQRNFGGDSNAWKQFAAGLMLTEEQEKPVEEIARRTDPPLGSGESG